ncbi:MAG: HigA family addiction module antitoxin [Thermomicrobiales bacterium]
MTMKNPPHPGRLLRADIEALELSVAEAAEGLGITRQQLYNVLNGKSAVTPDMAIRLEKGIGSSADIWLHLQASFDLAQARDRAAEINVERLVPKYATANPLH